MESEIQIAQIAKSRLYQHTAAQIHSQFTSRTGDSLEKLQVIPRFNKKQLVRLALVAPKYIFIQNYGFEGVKSNGVNMRLKQTGVVDNAIQNSRVIAYLSEALSELRADEITALIK